MKTVNKSDICAILTTFNPDNEFYSRVARISSQVSRVIIVNDSGRNESIIGLAEFENVEVIYNEFNSGIAYALNRGVKVATEKGFKCFLTFDDDTVIDENYVNEIIQFIKQHPELNIGVIALARESDKDSSSEDVNYRVKRTLITSGSFFTLDTFEKINGFNEDLFIDLVDYDFTTKIRKNGFKLIQLKKQGMWHSVGELKIQKLFGISFRVYNHSPFRLYYQVRNSFFFLKEFLFFDSALSLLLFSHIFHILFKAIIFEKSKKQRLYFITLGLFDGLFNRLGKIRD
ncbi:MAG: glycosyltransferase [Methylomarinum sp.]|nr:glycosyltransferase [Methylomarinum sp.]